MHVTFDRPSSLNKLEMNLRVPRQEFALADQALTAGANQARSRIVDRPRLEIADKQRLEDIEDALFIARSLSLAGQAATIIDQEIATFEQLDRIMRRFQDSDPVDDESVHPDYQLATTNFGDIPTFWNLLAQQQRDDSSIDARSNTYTDRIQPIVEKRLLMVAYSRDLMEHIDLALEYAEIDPAEQDIKMPPGPTQLAIDGLVRLKMTAPLKVRFQAWRAHSDILQSMVRES